MDHATRQEAYLSQNHSRGRRGLTPRQIRQLKRMRSRQSASSSSAVMSSLITKIKRVEIGDAQQPILSQTHPD